MSPGGPRTYELRNLNTRAKGTSKAQALAELKQPRHRPGRMPGAPPFLADQLSGASCCGGPPRSGR